MAISNAAYRGYLIYSYNAFIAVPRKNNLTFRPISWPHHWAVLAILDSQHYLAVCIILLSKRQDLYVQSNLAILLACGSNSIQSCPTLWTLGNTCAKRATVQASISQGFERARQASGSAMEGIWRLWKVKQYQSTTSKERVGWTKTPLPISQVCHLSQKCNVAQSGCLCIGTSTRSRFTLLA